MILVLKSNDFVNFVKKILKDAYWTVESHNTKPSGYGWLPQQYP